MTSLHGIYGVEIQNDDMDDPVLLGGITQQAIATGTEITNDISSGEVFSRFLAVSGQKPTASFTTRAIAAALDVIGLGGLPITSSENPGLNLYAYRHLDGSSRTPGETHRQYNISRGMIIPQKLSCEHRGNATLSYLVLSTFDGTNDPIVIAESVALPDGLVDDERFTLGEVNIGSASTPPQFTEITSFEIDFGIKAVAVGSDSDLWDTLVSIHTTQPKLTLKGLNLLWLADSGAIPLLGLPGTHAYTTIYLRKRAQGGTFMANNVAEHIAITADGLAYVDSAGEGTATDPQTASLMMPLRFDGTNDPIVFDTASEI